MAGHDDVRRDHGFHRLAVKRVVEETADARSYVLDVPEELHDVFAYRAGQFCTFRADVDGTEARRCYSMSSAPETDADLTVTVKRVPGGLVSNWFHDRVQPGDTIEVAKPAGTFCAREGERPVVAFCGGSGITPVISIAKSVLATTDRCVRILYANRDRTSVIFRDQLASLAERYGERLEVRHHFDADGGFLTVAAVAAFARPTLDADFYVCGPAPFMDLVEGTLVGAGVDLSDIASEQFTAETNPAVAAPAPAGPAPETVTLILGGRDHTVAYRAGDTILETARRAGLQAPYSCEAGNCATCMALLREGSATMRANNALRADEVDDGWILTCQAIPSGGTVVVEYESF